MNLSLINCMFGIRISNDLVTSFSIAVVVDKKWRFSVDNLIIGVQLADVSTRCSSLVILRAIVKRGVKRLELHRH